MDKSQVEKLFVLLGAYYPNAKQITDKRVQLAWVYALEPYDYDDVKAAAVEYARKSKYFPDVADLTAGLKFEEKRKFSGADDAVLAGHAKLKGWLEQSRREGE